MFQHIRKSFDRVAAEYNSQAIQKHHDADSRWKGEPGLQIRCVPWPEGAPDPATVPHAGEQVIFMVSSIRPRQVYEVVNGIPKKTGGGEWRLWISSMEGHGHRHAILADIEIYVPSFAPEGERTYTEAAIRAVLNFGGNFYADQVMDELKGGG